MSDRKNGDRAATGSGRSGAPAHAEEFTVRRAYEAPERSDGYRVLVDGLWPRGVSKDRARLDEWLKSVAPSKQLRHDLHDGRTRYEDFVRRYGAELDGDPDHADALAHLWDLAEQQPVTLITAVKDEDRQHSHIPVLLDHLAAHNGGGGRRARG